MVWCLFFILPSSRQAKYRCCTLKTYEHITHSTSVPTGKETSKHCSSLKHITTAKCTKSHLLVPRSQRRSARRLSASIFPGRRSWKACQGLLATGPGRNGQLQTHRGWCCKSRRVRGWESISHPPPPAIASRGSILARSHVCERATNDHNPS